MSGKLVRGAVLAVAFFASAQAAVAADRGGRAFAPNAARQAADGIPAQEIVSRAMAMMGDAKYLGFLYDPASHIYTLKFLRNGKVIWVDVDGRTGRIVRRSGG